MDRWRVVTIDSLRVDDDDNYDNDDYLDDDNDDDYLDDDDRDDDDGWWWCKYNYDDFDYFNFYNKFLMNFIRI